MTAPDVWSYWRSTETAVARHAIPDSPLAEVDGSARRGEQGDVVDVDELNGWVYVDFGRGAIACAPEEIK
jgi:hypothetical protein